MNSPLMAGFFIDACNSAHAALFQSNAGPQRAIIGIRRHLDEQELADIVRQSGKKRLWD
jgi:hypothetical protein